MSEHKRNPTALQFKPTGGGAAPSRVRDASGKILEVGDEVLIITPKTLMRVASVKPILHPGAPPNLMELILVTRLAIAVPRDTGVEDLYFLRHQAEIGDGAIETESPNGEPPVGDESGPAEKATQIELTDSER